MTGQTTVGEGHALLLCTNDEGLFGVVDTALQRHRLPLVCEPDAARGIDVCNGFALVLMDMASRGADPPALVQALRRRSSVPLIAIAPDRHPENAFAVLDRGADDCVGRPIHDEDLVARIRALLRRSRRTVVTADGPIQVADVQVAPATRTVSAGGIEICCTSAEYDVVDCLARSAGQAVSRDTLFAVVCGRSAAPLDRAIDVHVCNVRRKLKRTSARIVTVRGVGYMLIGDAGPHARPVADHARMLGSALDTRGGAA